MPLILIYTLVLTTLLLVLIAWTFICLRKCPPDKIMVVYGNLGKNPDGTLRDHVCQLGGSRFVIPIIQSVQYLDLSPIPIELDLHRVCCVDKTRIDILLTFTVSISIVPEVMENAAQCLIGLKTSAIHDLAKDIISGQLRLTVSTMEFEEIDENRDKFLEEVATKTEAELNKIGLCLININMSDITESTN